MILGNVVITWKFILKLGKCSILFQQQKCLYSYNDYLNRILVLILYQRLVQTQWKDILSDVIFQNILLELSKISDG